MEKHAEQNKLAWEYDAYNFWVKNAGTPEERAKKDIENPKKMLKRYAKYFNNCEGLKVANICGSCGKKAIPLALLGFEVTVFDISEDNKKYALEVAEAAKVHIDYVVGDVLEADMSIYGEYFDIVFMEGGILHYFHDINQFMKGMEKFLKTGGKMICSDFHPFQKISDILQFEQPAMSYFSTDIFEGEMAHAEFYTEEVRSKFPLCNYRKYTMSEIINAVIDNNFTLLHVEEHPAWTNENLPGEFTILAKKQ